MLLVVVLACIAVSVFVAPFQGKNVAPLPVALVLVLCVLSAQPTLRAFLDATNTLVTSSPLT